MIKEKGSFLLKDLTFSGIFLLSAFPLGHFFPISVLRLNINHIIQRVLYNMIGIPTLENKRKVGRATGTINYGYSIVAYIYTDCGELVLSK